jgi:hypothetical protein
MANGVDELRQGTTASGGAAARASRGLTAGACEQSDGAVASTLARFRRRGRERGGSERGRSDREREKAQLPIYRERGGRERAREREETASIIKHH